MLTKICSIFRFWLEQASSLMLHASTALAKGPNTLQLAITDLLMSWEGCPKEINNINY
jgi:hypothetical protein